MKQEKINKIIELWKEEKQKYVKQSTHATYVALIHKHLLPYFGDKEEILDSDIQSFILKKLDEGLTQKSVKDLMMILKMIVKFGVKQKLIEYHEINPIFPTERIKKDVEVLSKNDERKIIKYIKENLTFKNLGIYICLYTGLRIGEICALTWGDIDIDQGMLIIGKTIQRTYNFNKKQTELVIDAPKTINSYREIPLCSDLLKILKPLYRIMNKDYYVLSNSEYPIEPRTYRNYYKQFLNKLNIPFIKFHGLRHSFATRCIESKCDYKTVSVLLGHSSITTTMNLYVHPNLEQKRNCIRKMSKFLK